MKFCQIHKKYGWIRCENAALESDEEGFCILHSRMPNKDNKLFTDIINLKLLNEDYNFAGTFFPSEIHFSGIKFTKSVDFRQVIFNESSNFIKVNFDDEARFDSSIFLKGADFNRATFSGNTSFSNTTFNNGTYFVACIFKEDTNFDNAKYYGKGNYGLSVFYSHVSFYNIEIYGKLIFQAINLPKKDGSRDVFNADYGFLNIDTNGLVIFQDLSLEKVEFFGTDMRLIKLYNVEWYYLFGTLFDEVLLNKRQLSLIKYVIGRIRQKIAKSTKDQYYRIEVLYRYLKINYEKEGDLKQAGDFHYGEMNMHRKASFWRRRIPISWYNLYWALSGYGERPSWALTWLAVFLVGMAATVWWLGLSVANPPHMAGFGDSFIYLLQKATLQRPTWAEPVNFLGKLVAGLSVLLIPGQAALFLLALRNRLGRRR